MQRPPPPIGRYYAFRATQATALTLPVFALFFQSRGLTLAAIGLVEAVYTVVALLAETPTGYVGDRLGRRRTLTLSAILAGVGAAAFAVAHALWAFVLVVTVRAVAGALRSGTDAAWLYETLVDDAGLDADRFAHYRGRSDAVARLASGVTVLVGGALYALAPALPWLLEGAIVAAGAGLARSLPDPPRAGAPARGDRDDAPTPERRPGPLAALRAARSTLARPELATFVTFTAVVFAAVAAAHVVLQPVVVGLTPVEPAGLGVLYAVLVGAAAVVGSRSGWIQERVGTVWWFRLAPPAAGLLTLAAVAVPTGVLLAVVVLWALRAGSGPLVEAYVNDRVRGARATTLSAVAALRGLVVAPAKLAVGVLAGLSLSTAVAGIGAVLVAGTVAAVAVRSPLTPGAGTSSSEPVPGGD